MSKERNNQSKLKRLTTVGELCTALFGHLNAGEPQVPVGPMIANAMRAFLQELKEGQHVDSPPAYFAEILPEIYWNKVPPNAARYGLPLLMCVGCLSEAMHHREQYKLPLSQVALILRESYKGGGLLYTRRRGRWWIKSTPEYEKQFGTKVRVKLPRAPQENPLDLDPTGI